MSDLSIEQLQQELEALRQENARLKAAAADHARHEQEIAQLNQDLQHRVAELQTLLDVLPVAIGIAEDPECRRIRANPAFARLLALPPDANVSKTAPENEKPTTFRVCRNGVEIPAQELPIQVAAAQGVEVRDFEEEVVWSDGTTLSLVGYAAPLFDAQGKVRGSVGAFMDITERKRLEEQLLQAQKLESLGRLAGGVAHDFNNMLTAIRGFAELAEEELPPDSPAQQPLQNIRAAAERAADLTSQLLAFARRQVIAPKVVNPNALIREIDPLLRRLIGEHIEMLVVPQPDLGSVRIDPGQFAQVLINLAINGRDAMPEGGRLIIETANVTLDAEYAARHAGVVPGEYVKLTVSDTGIGMSAEVREHIFEPFFTTKELGRGTGLGLASCYGIVQQNGGHIWVYSEPGRSTTFTIYLPRVYVAESPAAQQAAVAAALPRGTETILLAEDEETVRDFAALTLRGLGYTVLVADNGAEALRRAAAHEGEIHLLLTDVVMPQMSGTALAELLRAARPHLRVLYTSGYTENTIVHHGVLKPDIAFLHKPYTIATLAQKVRQVLETETAGGTEPPQRGDTGVEHRSD